MLHFSKTYLAACLPIFGHLLRAQKNWAKKPEVMPRPSESDIRGWLSPLGGNEEKKMDGTAPEDMQ